MTRSMMDAELRDQGRLEARRPRVVLAQAHDPIDVEAAVVGKNAGGAPGGTRSLPRA